MKKVSLRDVYIKDRKEQIELQRRWAENFDRNILGLPEIEIDSDEWIENKGIK